MKLQPLDVYLITYELKGCRPVVLAAPHRRDKPVKHTNDVDDYDYDVASYQLLRYY